MQKSPIESPIDISKLTREQQAKLRAELNLNINTSPDVSEPAETAIVAQNQTDEAVADTGIKRKQPGKVLPFVTSPVKTSLENPPKHDSSTKGLVTGILTGKINLDEVKMSGLDLEDFLNELNNKDKAA